MIRLLLKKFVGESSFLFLACALLLFVFCLGRVWIICQFDLQQFEPFLQQLKPFEKYMPVPLEQVLTHAGSLALTLNEPVLLLSILVWCIARGSDVVSGELGRGTMEMLLAQPISRRQLLITHAAASAAGLAALCGIVWLGIYVGIHSFQVKETIATTANLKIPFLPIQVPVQIGPPMEVFTPLSQKVDSWLYVLPCLNLFSFGFVVLSLSILLSSLDRFRWRTIGGVLSVYIVQMLMYLLSKAMPATAAVGNFTIMTLYQPDAMVLAARQQTSSVWALHGSSTLLSETVWKSAVGPLGMPLILIALGLTMLVTAVIYFDRRDLAAPL